MSNLDLFIQDDFLASDLIVTPPLLSNQTANLLIIDLHISLGQKLSALPPIKPNELASTAQTTKPANNLPPKIFPDFFPVWGRQSGFKHLQAARKSRCGMAKR